MIFLKNKIQYHPNVIYNSQTLIYADTKFRTAATGIFLPANSSHPEQEPDIFTQWM